MRVSNYLKRVILEALQESFAPEEVILFGSRVDDEKRGGDLDIAIKTDLSRQAFRAAKVQFDKRLLLKDLDLPIDLIHYDHAPAALRRQIDMHGIGLK